MRHRAGVAITKEQIPRLFAYLTRPDAIPPPRSLSALVNGRLARGDVRLNEREATLFMTAAVDMWQRSVHSFVLSVALTRVSALWSSVSGYYSSHYAIRAIAHLHGFLAVFQRREFLETTLAGGRYCCERMPISNAKRREHQFYWAVVRRLPGFGGDSLFPENDESVESDASHRNYANYSDHLDRLTRLEAVSVEELRDRIENVAVTALEGVPTRPDWHRFPDLTNVVNGGYLRVYRFREYLDEMLPARNPFWRAAREAPWFMNVMRFPPRPSEGVRAM